MMSPARIRAITAELHDQERRMSGLVVAFGIAAVVDLMVFGWLFALS